MARYLSRAAAARVYGITPAAVGQATKPGRALHEAAIIHDGKPVIDMEHPAAVAYRAGHRVGSAEDIEGTIGKRGRSPTRELELEEVIRRYWDLSLREIIERHGTIPAFAQLLAAADKIEGIHAKRLAADKSTGELISRQYVREHVIGLVEAITHRMLGEMPIKLSYEVHGLCSTGAPVEEVQEAIRNAVTRELRTAKLDVERAIRRAAE